MTNPSSPKRLVVAINPSARFGANKGVGSTMVEKLRGLGHDVVDLLEPSYAELIASAKREIAKKPDALIVVGGDGMVNLGVNLVAGTGVPLGLIPAGTGNDMARSLGIPHEDQEAALEVLIEALNRPARVIDAGLVTDAAGETRWFGCMLSAGFDSIVNERANRMQHPKGASRYTIAMLLELVTIKPIQYKITHDGKTLESGGMLVSVGNGVSLGGGMKVTPTAIVDDGVLDILVVGPLTRIQFLRIFPKVFAGTHIEDPRVQIIKAKKIRIEADTVIAYTDGERFAPLPIDIEVKPGALKVFAPPVSMVEVTGVKAKETTS
ncbi:MAG TPA: YegS/Rv2252/BmrU family lipid kinase [Galbitalea sp.]|jgi:diacylglycerol kinase (ATP)|nr:YegS/Rv2252/BmrU family lipid kinase [Galbitalea sp.]